MFNLLVTHEAQDQEHGVFRVTKDRFLEHTAPSIRDALESLSDDAIEAMRTWPCVLMDEGRDDGKVLLGEITKIEQTQGGISLHFMPLPDGPNLLNADLWKLRNALGIQDFEFNRNHWAVKDRDILVELSRSDYEIPQELTRRFEVRPLPSPTRKQLLTARNALAERGHTDIDDFLLEAGVSSLEADRSVGSRKDRANAIVKFILENPGVVTAENRLLSLLFIEWANLNDTGNEEDAEGTDAHSKSDGDISFPLLSNSKERSTHPNKVFVVHGQDGDTRDKIVSFLQAAGLHPIVLHEQPNMGRHLLTKFIEEAELVTFAVVLMTDDDVGGPKGGQQSGRARQNVILELGYFLAHLNQRRVCAMKTPGVETPSDFDGIVYITIDDTEQWKEELLRELRAAEMPVRDEIAS